LRGRALQPDVLHSEARVMAQSELLPQRWRQADDKVKLIPKIIHQTYKSSVVPEHLLWLVRTWRDFNPRYEIRFYDDAACDNFVATEFPGACVCV
jgi:mannosyltransferase OCH1-like enzyme